MTIDSFGRAFGLNNAAEVGAFCQQHAGLFQIQDAFVCVVPVPLANQADLAQKIEKLARLVVFLEGETSTYITSKAPAVAGSTTSGGQ